jgi:enamine deaminase RidA (YjgF/YER057c/UK114 family)
MLARRYINPSGHWRLGLKVANSSQGIVCNKFIFVAGQVDLDERTKVRHPGDLAAQATGAMAYLGRVLAGAGADMGDLVKLTVFYLSDGSIDEDDLLRHLGGCLGPLSGPGPAVTAVPLPGLAYPGMLIEIEGIAMRHPNGQRLGRVAAWSPECQHHLPPPFSLALRCEELIFTSAITSRDARGAIAHSGDIAAQSRVMLGQLNQLLRLLGADLDDTVKTNVFNVDGGSKASWAEPALIRAGHYREPGPAATGITLPRLWPAGVMTKNDVIAMRGVDGSRLPRTHVWPDNHWDWTVHLPYRHGVRCGDLVFLGGQVPLAPDAAVLASGDMVAQTRIAMDYIGRILSELGMGFGHVVKVNSFYTGAVGEEILRPNVETRFSYFPAQGPTSTGVPVTSLAYEGMLTEIDIIAMA